MKIRETKNAETAVPGASWASHHREILTAIAGRIVPSEDGPGAAETGVADFLVQACLDRYSTEVHEVLNEQLEILDHRARESQGLRFVDGPPHLQDTLLESWSSEADSPARWVFRRLVDLCLEGFLGDPSHGGNRDRLGWRYLGLDGEHAPDACVGLAPEPTDS